VAEFVVRTVEAVPDAVLGLPTGRTTVPVYSEIVRVHQRGRADFRGVTSFNLDEFIGIPAGHPGRYQSFMERHLFRHLTARPVATHYPDPARGGPAYDRLIAGAGGLDLCVVGIGENGHIGFNEPGRHLERDTHRARLLPATRRANAYLFGGDVRRVPREAMSMGIGTILSARMVLLLATGADKAPIVGRAFGGRISTRVPASLLQAHPNALVVLDRAAARKLQASSRGERPSARQRGQLRLARRQQSP
jgi:glucosamine-6-phosphate deaminase